MMGVRFEAGFAAFRAGFLDFFIKSFLRKRF
jgi:hypothetical protein